METGIIADFQMNLWDCQEAANRTSVALQSLDVLGHLEYELQAGMTEAVSIFFSIIPI